MRGFLEFVEGHALHPAGSSSEVLAGRMFYTENVQAPRLPEATRRGPTGGDDGRVPGGNTEWGAVLTRNGTDSPELPVSTEKGLHLEKMIKTQSECKRRLRSQL